MTPSFQRNAPSAFRSRCSPPVSPRTVGWMVQLKEMIGDPEYKIGRPCQLFTGSEAREVKPIGQRQAVTLSR